MKVESEREHESESECNEILNKDSLGAVGTLSHMMIVASASICIQCSVG